MNTLRERCISLYQGGVKCFEGILQIDLIVVIVSIIPAILAGVELWTPTSITNVPTDVWGGWEFDNCFNTGGIYYNDEIGIEADNLQIAKEGKIEVLPNPFSQFTVISYEIPIAGEVSLQIYDVSGRLVKTLIHRTKEIGTRSITLNASGMINGIYFLKLETDNATITKKLVIVKQYLPL